MDASRCLYRERDLVLGPGSFVERRHAVFGSEVQVSSSVLQDLDDLHHIVQVSCKCQRTLWRKKTEYFLISLIFYLSESR